MGSSLRLFRRQRTVHQILGGGFIADVMLWRRRDLTVGILWGTVAAWVLFELSGYNPLSLASNVLLLFFFILFVWANCAEVIKRPPPPLPELYISEEVISEAAVFIHSQVNAAISFLHDIAAGKDSNSFYKLAATLLLISFIGSCTDFLSFVCFSTVILLTFPVLYEKYEYKIDRYVLLTLVKLQLYERVYEEFFSEGKEWIIENMKES